MHIWVPKKKRGLHCEGRARLIDVDGRQLWDSGWRHNLLHDGAEELLLNRIFEPAFTTYPWMIVAKDCSYDHADGVPDMKLTDRDAGTPFAKVMANDYLFLCGGYTAGGTSVTSGYYRVASKVDGNNIGLTTDPTGAAADITGGIVVIRAHNFAIGLDKRTSLAEDDDIGTVESYEQSPTGTGYYRQLVDPDDATNTPWTVAKDTTTGDYQATSMQVLFTCAGATFTAMNNAFLVAGLVDTDANGTYLESVAADWSNDLLISSISFGGSITVAVGQSLPVQFRIRLREVS